MAISNQRLNIISEAGVACDRELILIQREIMNLQANVNQVSPARLIAVLQAQERAINELSRAMVQFAEGHREERGGAAASGHR